MSHELQVVNEVSLFLGWRLLELSQFFHKYVEVDFKFFLILIRLSLYSVLQLSQRHRLLILIETESASVLLVHEVIHLGVLASLSVLCCVLVRLCPSTFTSPLVSFHH